MRTVPWLSTLALGGPGAPNCLPGPESTGIGHARRTRRSTRERMIDDSMPQAA
jgi:hypothetical protein